MNESIETEFEEQGSLEKPLLMGRLVRLLIGVALLYLAYPLISDFEWLIENGIPLYALNLVSLVFIFWVLPLRSEHWLVTQQQENTASRRCHSLSAPGCY